MILGEIRTGDEVIHIESKRIATVLSTNLQIKVDRRWQTAILYRVHDKEQAMFAVPVDDFRQRFAQGV